MASSQVSHLIASFPMGFPKACLLALSLRSSYTLAEVKLSSDQLTFFNTINNLCSTHTHHRSCFLCSTSNDKLHSACGFGLHFGLPVSWTCGVGLFLQARGSDGLNLDCSTSAWVVVTSTTMESASSTTVGFAPSAVARQRSHWPRLWEPFYGLRNSSHLHQTVFL